MGKRTGSNNGGSPAPTPAPTPVPLTIHCNITAYHQAWKNESCLGCRGEFNCAW
jgi:hypothetical protein